MAPVSKDGAAPWFETPRTRLRNPGRLKIAAPHHEAGRGRACVKLIGLWLGSPTSLHFLDRLAVPADAQPIPAQPFQHDRDGFRATRDVAAPLQIERLVDLIIRHDAAIGVEPAHGQRLDDERRLRLCERLAVTREGPERPAPL